MYRFLFAAAVVFTLAACAPTRYAYYGEDQYRSYPAQTTQVSVSYGVGGGAYHYPDWIDTPAYYSLFWSFNRSYVDPYYHPHFYYGVTWFPRNYYSTVYRGHPYYRNHWRPYYSYLSYSPYRGAWVDYYYDWYPYYAYHPRRHHDYDRYYAPRYGSARNEAERLAQFSRGHRGYRADDGYSPRRWDDHAGQREAVIDRREAVRGADYGSRSSRRIDPEVSGFRDGSSDYRSGGRGELGRGGQSGGDRIDPAVSGFQNPREAVAPRGGVSPRAPSYGSDSSREVREVGSSSREVGSGIPYPYRSGSSGREADTGSVRTQPRGARQEIAPATDYRDRGSQPERSAPRYVEPREQGRYSSPREAPTYSAPAESPRYSAPREASTYSAPREQTRYAAPREANTYSAPREQVQYSAPRESFSAPEPRREAPRYSAPERESAPRESYDRSASRAEIERVRGDDSER